MTLTTAQQAQTCTACASDPTAAPSRYCARFRCYCGHAACPSYAHYQHARPRLRIVRAPSVPPRDTSAWDTREEGSTWIDSM